MSERDTCTWCDMPLGRRATLWCRRRGPGLMVCCSEACLRSATRRDDDRLRSLESDLRAAGLAADPRPARNPWGLPAALAVAVLVWAAVAAVVWRWVA